MADEALLIIDMSNDFVHERGGLTVGKPAQEIVPFIVKQAENFLMEEKPVFFCMDAHEENDPHFRLWPKHNVRGTWGQKLYGELEHFLKKHQGHPLVDMVEKTEYDAFYQTDLCQRLRSFGVKRVYLTGVCTDICVFLTAYGAYARGLETVVYREGCQTFTGRHALFLDQMEKVFQSNIV